MLCTLAQASMRSENGHIRNRFQQLSVVGFFVKEMSLEFEAMEHGSRFSQLRSESSVDSTGLDRSTSQNSVGGGSCNNAEDDKAEVQSSHKDLRVPRLSFVESGGESITQLSDTNLHLEGNQPHFTSDVPKKMSPSASGASTSDLRIPAANLDAENQSRMPLVGSKSLSAKAQVQL